MSLRDRLGSGHLIGGEPPVHRWYWEFYVGIKVTVLVERFRGTYTGVVHHWKPEETILISRMADSEFERLVTRLEGSLLVEFPDVGDLLYPAPRRGALERIVGEEWVG